MVPNYLQKWYKYFIFSMILLIPNLTLAATLEGVFGVVWGDTKPSSDGYILSYSLAQDNGVHIPLDIPEAALQAAGGISRLNGKTVTVETTVSSSTPSGLPEPGTPIPPFSITGISLSADNNSPDVSPLQAPEPLSSPLAGGQEYVSILCKFSDIADEPRDIGFFNEMYGDSFGQLGHYWKQVSSDKINLAGSRAYGGATGDSGWYTLPQARPHYVDDTKLFPERGANLDNLFADCVNEADAHIDFTNVKGINLMFNGNLDCCAWGGGHYATLDGITKVWPTTWNPTWAWQNVTVIAHEMGHSFGLPHSNNSDEDANPYDSPWTVMSHAYSGVYSPAYGWLGYHLNAHEKIVLDWSAASEVMVAPSTAEVTADLDWLSNATASAGAYRSIVIPIETTETYSKYYTIEARVKGGDYEASLPGTAVIIHSVDTSRTEPAWVVDEMTPASDFADTDGVMWLTGEKFIDSDNGLEIEVLSENSNGFQVKITRTNLDSGTKVPWPVIFDLLLDTPVTTF